MLLQSTRSTTLTLIAVRVLPRTVSRLTSRQHITPLRTSVRCLTLALRSTNPPRPPPLHSARVLPPPPHSHPLQSLRRQQSTQSPTNEGQPQGAVQSFPDPDRPDLFYHLFAPPTALSSTTPVFALSFLATPPPSILSSTILGWLPASGEGDGAGLNDFVENGELWLWGCFCLLSRRLALFFARGNEL